MIQPVRTLPQALAPLLAVTLAACSDGGPPAWCGAKQPLELSCTGPRCVVGVMVDYVRLEPRGFLVRETTQSKQITSAVEAETIATEHVTKALGGDQPDLVDSDRAGDFYLCWLAYDPTETKDSWLVVVHASSGEVVFAGLEVWADPDRGYDPPLPPGWQGPAALGCTDAALDPVDRALRTTGIPMGSEPASTAAEALAVAQRLNLVDSFTAGKPYHAMVVSYSTDTGEFDPRSADWLIWITRDN